MGKKESLRRRKKKPERPPHLGDFTGQRESRKKESSSYEGYLAFSWKEE